MKITKTQTIFLATIGMVAVLFLGLEVLNPSKEFHNSGLGANPLKYTTASLLTASVQNENTITSDKVTTAVQVSAINVPVVVEPVSVNMATSMRLEIPEINVDAKIDSMGVTKNGAMESPSGSQDVGWFSFGPRPGESGSAVLAGHYGRWKNGDVSVFDNLHTLKPGDKIYIQDKDGVTITFIVRQLHTYDKNDDASQVFTSDDGASHLNIIACAGVYDDALKTYSQRLVVFADKQ